MNVFNLLVGFSLKLIQQANLFFQDGRSDKVYEVDLCEVGDGQYVVNFRYGRRGSTLRDGTKTAAPVSLDQAQSIFDNLVESKTSKGYLHTSDITPAAQPAQPVIESNEVSATSAGPPPDPRVLGVLHRLREGHNSTSTWSLSRAVWRAGEMGIRAAEPFIAPLAGGNDVMLNYCVAAALGRCGSAASVPLLDRMQNDAKFPEHVRRAAAESLMQLLPADQRITQADLLINALPAPLNRLARGQDTDQFLLELRRFLEGGDAERYKVLEHIYAINNHCVRHALMAILRDAPLEPPYFKQLRRIFKFAELRRDGQVFGALARRFETTRASFKMPGSWYYEYRKKEKKPTIDPNASKAFSSQTREYLCRRTWQTLARLGKLDSIEYVHLAVGVLIAFTDEDAKPVRSDTRWVYSGRRYQSQKIYWDTFGSYWAFNQILFRNSPRYREANKSFTCAADYQPGGPVPVEREESFPHLWEREPAALLYLLTESRCEPVHHFAVKALRACPDFCNGLDVNAIKVLLASAYAVTLEFGLDLAIQRYDAANPDFELVLLLANCPVGRARQQAHEWINADRATFLQNDEFTVSLLTSEFADTRNFGFDAIRVMTLDLQRCQSLITRLIAFVLALEPEQSSLAGDVAEGLSSRVFAQAFRTIGQDVILDLLAHSIPQVQALGSHIVLEHETLASHPTEAILRGLLGATDASVRRIGVQLIGRQSDETLLDSAPLLVVLIRHEHADIRDEIRPTIQRLAASNPKFGQQMAAALIDALLVPGAPDGVPSYTAKIIREDLLAHCAGISTALVFTLLQSRSGPAQDVGGMLLQSNVDPTSLTVEQIVKLASHDTLSVREASWNICNQQLDRLAAAMSSTVRIVDAKWEDSRKFAFDLFREKLNNGELTPDILVSICDSVRPDVQQFGREMITQRFKEEHGQEYLLKLSEHPSTALQRFATHYLERYAAGHLDRIRELIPYFVIVLTKVNQGRVAKDRVLAFLEQEAIRSEGAAQIVARLMDHISATIAVGDKAKAVEIMLAIHSRYPDIPLPITLQPVEVR